MNAFGKSQQIRRLEDVRFLTGHGRYVDDIAPAGALVAQFLRAPMAHAAITALDVTAARTAPGVAAVLTIEDMDAAGVARTMKTTPVTGPDGQPGATPERPVLARGRVRFVGEAVALILAETPDQARDAAELIEVDYAEEAAHIALAPGGPTIHPEAPDNIAYDWAAGDAPATDAAFDTAAHRVALRLAHNRIICNAMEPRGATAEWDGARLHLCFGGQGVWGPKAQLAAALGLEADAVRVTVPDVGGGFGMKAMMYPEYIAIAAAARALGRPVRWMSDRTEAMLTDNAGRDLISEAELAFDADHRITGYRVRILSNLGAYNSGFAQNIQSTASSKVLTGVYDIPAAHVRATGIFTNTTQVDAYRGAGRPEAIYTLERTLDHAARVLGVSPTELRRRNFIRPDQMPYATPSGETYDTGDFARTLTRAEADVAGFATRRAASQAAGRLRGLGVCSYIEAILGDPSEGATVEFCDDGTVNLYVGTVSNGQGHETVYAQFLAERTGLPIDAIRVIQADSDRIEQGGGTGGSRSVTVQGMATLGAVEEMVAAFSTFLEGELGMEGVTFDGATFRADGTNRTPTLLEAADMVRAAGRTDLLRHAARRTLDGRSYPNGTHIAEVEIDPDTGALEIVRYTVTDDFGNLIHPQLAEGQVHGGIAQGFGQAVCEFAAHDTTGQQLTASFMDYAMPRASDLPMVRFTTEPVPSVNNPLGMKGCGEAGTVGALAAIGNAVQDALWDRGVRQVDMPFTPARLWTLLHRAGQ
ncbi:xanthine dehydrogenase family protein molybdopterin-binding subunit [Rhodobaculum claviforme]|uniref:Xanthine dehydrogenase n=1 Tax=Rhodobaculum claviforme TaxID=1549854 RepID=A0A934TN51_9RHOB|nr:xanthine dehydrogenase family protein molybdopterin-binding subunit [Rhodobaculum claviforme]MBK5928733.1 xanthine dehydrogenase [Rhodobaculum claviforme]